MNVFYLDHDTVRCAQFHNDKHVVKMVLEYSQLLSTAHRCLEGNQMDELKSAFLYKSTHVNHPSAIWCRSSSGNYRWLSNLLIALCSEYTYRYGKTHKCERIGLVKMLQTLPNGISIADFSEPPCAMPDEVKIKDNVIASYRNYYKLSKMHIASWKGKIHSRDIPYWIDQP